MSLNDYFLDMDIEEMCDELGITQDDILHKFRDKVYAYYKRVDRGYERDLLYGYDDYDKQDEEEYEEYKRYAEDDEE